MAPLKEWQRSSRCFTNKQSLRAWIPQIKLAQEVDARCYLSASMWIQHCKCICKLALHCRWMKRLKRVLKASLKTMFHQQTQVLDKRLKLLNQNIWFPRRIWANMTSQLKIALMWTGKIYNSISKKFCRTIIRTCLKSKPLKRRVGKQSEAHHISTPMIQWIQRQGLTESRIIFRLNSRHLTLVQKIKILRVLPLKKESSRIKTPYPRYSQESSDDSSQFPDNSSISSKLGISAVKRIDLCDKIRKIFD